MNGLISLPEISRQASRRSVSEAIGVSESVESCVCQRRREKLSTTDTSCPACENRIAVGQPRYPSPPRIRTLMTGRGYRMPPVETGADLLPPELTAIRA